MTTDLSITASGEDGFIDAAAGTMSLTSTSVIINGVGDQGWFRFTDVAIPRGSTINSCSFKYWGESTSGASAVQATIQFEDTGNSPSLTTSDTDSSRTWGTASSAFTILSVSNTQYTLTTGLATLLQTIVNKLTWSSGNALTLRLKATTVPAIHSRALRTYDNANANKLAILSVDYTPVGSSNSCRLDLIIGVTV